MEFQNKHPKIYLIAGKARQGKDTVGDFIARFYQNKKVIYLEYSHYIKEYAKKVSEWDGTEETKPRELLQHLGTNLIRNQIDELFFVRRMCEDIQVYSYFYDVIIVTGVRFEIEITALQAKFPNVHTIHVERPNLRSELTNGQQQHQTEIGLHHFEQYDYKIINDSTLEALKEKVEVIVKEVETL